MSCVRAQVSTLGEGEPGCDRRDTSFCAAVFRRSKDLVRAKAAGSPSRLGEGSARKIDEFSLQQALHAGGPGLISACFLLQRVKDYFPLGGTAEGNDKAAADTALIKKKEQEKGKKKTCQDWEGGEASHIDSAGGRNVETREFLGAAWSPGWCPKRNTKVPVRLELWLPLAQKPPTHSHCLWPPKSAQACEDEEVSESSQSWSSARPTSQSSR